MSINDTVNAARKTQRNKQNVKAASNIIPLLIAIAIILSIIKSL